MGRNTEGMRFPDQLSPWGGLSFHAVLAGPKSDPSAAEGEHCYPRGWPG